MKTADFPAIKYLSVSEKLLLVEALWDDVREEVDLPIPAWHLKALEESAEVYGNVPREGSSWAEVKKRILSH